MSHRIFTMSIFNSSKDFADFCVIICFENFDFQKEILGVECDEVLSNASIQPPHYSDGTSGITIVKKASA